MFHMSEVCLYDEIDWGRGDHTNGSRDRLRLLGGGIRARRIVGSVRKGIVVGADEIRGSYRRSDALFVV